MTIRALNIKLKIDERIKLSQLPVGYGLTLCLKHCFYKLNQASMV